MQTVLSYLYDQVILAVVVDPLLPNTRNNIMYAAPIKIFRGIDNPIKIQVKNQDQKPVNLINKTLTFILMNYADRTAFLERTVTVIDPQKGIAQIILSDEDLLNLPAKAYNYSIKVVDGEGRSSPAYVAENYRADGVIEVKDNIYPEFSASQKPSISSLTVANLAYSSACDAGGDLRSTGGLHTMQLFANTFTGWAEIQGTLDPIPYTEIEPSSNINWVTIDNIVYNANVSGTTVTNFNGMFNSIRVKVTRDATNPLLPLGDISKILYRT